MSVRLELGSNTLTLDAANGFYVRELDLGYPAVREVTYSRPGANGIDDVTAYFGGRIVSLDLVATGTKRTQFDALGLYLRPGTRPYLYFTQDAEERRIRLRASGRSAPFRAPSNILEAQVQWVAPDGVIEAATATSLVAQATSGVEDGRDYDLTFDRSYAPTNPIGTVNAVNAGTVAVLPTVQLFGPCTNPKLENLTTGEEISFTITLTSTQWLEVDFVERTVLLNNVASQSEYDTLDIATSSWWTLQPGSNLVRYQPGTVTSGAYAVVTYRSAWI